MRRGRPASGLNGALREGGAQRITTEALKVIDPTGPFSPTRFTLNNYELIILFKLAFEVGRPAKSIPLR